MALSAEFRAHLKTGITTLCRAWAVTRRDGAVFGFTDHDSTLSFEGITFRADTGLGARALQQATGLAVDNSEAVGLLSDAALREDEIIAGRFDGAEVRAWLVNWQDVAQRALQFRGTIGEVSRTGSTFTAELRGLTEGLNEPQGRVFQSPCSAVLGDARCKFDLSNPLYFHEGPVEAVTEQKGLTFSNLTSFDDRWFEAGRLTVLSGTAKGLVGLIKNDRLSADQRAVELWQTIGAPLAPGDLVRLEAGCDKRAGTCRFKFNNLVNFQGFPHIPGEDWLMAYPSSRQQMTGGSLKG